MFSKDELLDKRIAFISNYTVFSRAAEVFCETNSNALSLNHAMQSETKFVTDILTSCHKLPFNICGHIIKIRVQYSSISFEKTLVNISIHRSSVPAHHYPTSVAIIKFIVRHLFIGV